MVALAIAVATASAGRAGAEMAEPVDAGDGPGEHRASASVPRPGESARPLELPAVPADEPGALSRIPHHDEAVPAADDSRLVAAADLAQLESDIESDLEAEDLDPEIPVGGVDDLVPAVRQASASVPVEEDPDSVIDWRAAARKLKGMLMGPVDAIGSAVRRHTGGKKSKKVRMATTSAPLADDEVIALLRLRPIVPVQGKERSDLTDSFFARRSGHRRHNAIDIPAPEGTPLVAAIDGTVVKMSNNKLGGTSLYLVDDAGRFSFFYAHLSAYADDLVPGMKVQKGDLVGFVGRTGNARHRGPHLHMALTVLSKDGGDKVYKKRAILNPYPLLAFIP